MAVVADFNAGYTTMALGREQKAAMYARELSTQDRKVELVQFELHASFILEKFTKFRVAGPATVTKGVVQYLPVTITSGQHNGKGGYLPRSTVHDYGRVGETLVSGGGEIHTKTGITYGGNKCGFESNQFPSVFEIESEGTRCRYCGGKRSAHRIWETDRSLGAVTRLYDALLGEDVVLREMMKLKVTQTNQVATAIRKGFTAGDLKLPAQGAAIQKSFTIKQEKQLKGMHTGIDQLVTGFGPNAQVMLGVLLVEGRTPWAAYSGDQKTMGPFSDFFVHVCQQLEFRFAPYVAEGEYLIGRSNTRTNSRALTSCAAVKLFQAANHASENPVAMSEMWFNPNQEARDPALPSSKANYKYGNKRTIESCDSCRVQIPAMLCPFELLHFRMQSVD